MLLQTSTESPYLSPLVVIVDDDPALGNLASLILKKSLNCRTLVFTGLRDFNPYLNSIAALDQTPDLFILDLLMPGMSGLDICRDLIRTHPFAHSVPVLLVTSVPLVHLHNRPKPEDAGVSKVILLPYTMQHLSTIAEDLLSGSLRKD